MIRIVNAQGFATLINDPGVAFQMPTPLARELYRRPPPNKEALRTFLDFWGGDSHGVERLVEDEYETEALVEGLNNLGLPFETLLDIHNERSFFVETRGQEPTQLVLHPSELGILATAFAKEGQIEENPNRAIKDEAARVFLAAMLGLAVSVDEGLKVGEFR